MRARSPAALSTHPIRRRPLCRGWSSSPRNCAAPATRPCFTLQGHLAAAPPRRGDRPGTRRAGHRVRPEHAQPRLQHLRHRRGGHGQVQHRPGPGRPPRAHAAGPGRLVPRQQLPGRVPPARHRAAARPRRRRSPSASAGWSPTSRRRSRAAFEEEAYLKRLAPAEGPVRLPAADRLPEDRALRRRPGPAPRLHPARSSRSCPSWTASCSRPEEYQSLPRAAQGGDRREHRHVQSEIERAGRKIEKVNQQLRAEIERLMNEVGLASSCSGACSPCARISRAGRR